MSDTPADGAIASPYPGLRPFRQREAPIFFGRGEQVAQMLAPLEENRFLAVVGASGSGKSSLVRAGLLPALQEGLLLGAGTQWCMADMRPGQSPFANLASALHEALKCGGGDRAQPPPATFLLAALRSGSLGLVEAVEDAGVPEDVSVLVLADQFEEIFRFRHRTEQRMRERAGGQSLADQRNEATGFVNLLLATARQSRRPIYVLLTMRSDFLGDCDAFLGLPEAINDSQFLTPRLNRDQMRQAITGPLPLFDARAEPALVNRVLNDVGTDRDQLPLMQHALMRTWMRARRRCEEQQAPVVLQVDDYNAVGAFRKALSNHADEAWDELGGGTENETARQRIARMMFLCLSEVGRESKSTRRLATVQEVADVAGVAPEQVIEVARAFQEKDRNFLVASPPGELTAATTLDISHEALLRQWKRLGKWLERENESASMYRRLLVDARDWQEKKASPLRPPRLDLALKWQSTQRPTNAWARRYGGGFDLVEDFLRAGERLKETELRKKRNRTRLLIGTTVVMAILAIGAIVAGLYAHGRKLEAEFQHRIALAHQLVAQLDLTSQDRDALQRSALLAIESIRLYPTLEADQALRTCLAMWRRCIRQVSLEEGNTIVAADPTGAYLATRSDHDATTIKTWDAATGRALATLTHGGAVRFVLFAPNGARLATVSAEIGGAAGVSDTTINVWDTTSGTVVATASGVGYVQRLAFSPDGKHLAVATSVKESGGRRTHSVQLREGETGSLVVQIPQDERVAVLAIGPNGRYAAFGGADGSARLWDMASGTKVLPLPHSNGVNTIAFSPDGRHLAMACHGGTQLVDIQSWKDVWLPNADSYSARIAFSPNGEYLATSGYRGIVQVWKVATGREIALLKHPWSVDKLLFGPGSGFLATVTRNGTVRLWKEPRFEEVGRIVHEQALGAMVFVQEGALIGTATRNVWRLWQTEPRGEAMIFRHPYEIHELAVSPTGEYVATGTSGDNRVRIWRLRDGQLATTSPKHIAQIEDIDFSPDGTMLAEVRLNGTLRVSRVPSGEPLKELDLKNVLSAVAFHPSGKSVAVGMQEDEVFGRGKDGSVVLDLSDWHEVIRVDYRGEVTDVAFSSDGLRLAVATRTARGDRIEDDAVRFWDLARTTETAHLLHEGEVNAVVFSPDGKYIATAVGGAKANDKSARSVQIWDAARGRLVSDLKHEDYVPAIAFSPDGAFLATACADGAAHVWELAGAREVGRVEHDRSVQDVAFTPDGRYLVTASRDKTVRMWLWHPDDLLEAMYAQLTRNLTAGEWEKYLGNEPYRKTCPTLPVHPSVIQAALELARKGKMETAIERLIDIQNLEPAAVSDPRQMARQARAKGLKAQAENAAMAGEIGRAIALFENARNLDPDLGINPQAEARRFEAQGLGTRAWTLIRKGEIKEAIAAARRAEALDPKMVSAEMWNDLCWTGSLRGHAKDVLFAGEKAVEMEPTEPNIRDTRGLARALTGDRKGAADDFHFFVTHSPQQSQQTVLRQRQVWIEQLKDGKNPFTSQTLKTLESEF